MVPIVATPNKKKIEPVKAIMSDIVLKEKIGGGNFGEVYLGLWHVRKFTIILISQKIGNHTCRFEKTQRLGSDG